MQAFLRNCSVDAIFRQIKEGIHRTKSIPTLKEVALNVLAIVLWKSDAMKERITSYFENNEGLTFYNRGLCTLEPEYEFFSYDWSQVERHMFQQTKRIKMRRRKLTQQLNHAIAMIGMQIKEWLKCLLMVASPASDRQVLKQFVNFTLWTIHGKIHKEFFVDILFDSGKYEILDVINNFPLHYSYVPIEYFWRKLGPSVREEIIEKFCSEVNLGSYREDTFFFLLCKINESQLKSIIENNPYGLIYRLVSLTRPWQGYFTLAIYYLYTIITEEQRSSIKSWLIKQVVIKGYYYRKILLYLWNKDKHDYQSLAKNSQDLDLLFNFRDFDVYRKMITKAKRDDKKKMIASVADICICLLNSSNEVNNCMQMLDNFLYKIFRSIDDVKSAKNVLFDKGYCYYRDEMCQSLFETFCDWCGKEYDSRNNSFIDV